MPKYPKTLYVKEQTEAAGDKWLNAGRDPVDHAELGEKAQIGVYKLVEIVEIKGVAITNTVRKVK